MICELVFGTNSSVSCFACTKAAQVWNEWIHEEDQTLQSGSSNNSNSTASMSVTEEALRNTQQQQQLKQPCYNDRINSPNRLHRFSAESPLVSILPFTNAQMQQFPKRTSTEFIAQNRYAQQDAYRSYHMFRYYSSSNAQCNRMVMVPPARSIHYILHSIYFTLTETLLFFRS
jgi:hypothetical protein